MHLPGFIRSQCEIIAVHQFNSVKKKEQKVSLISHELCDFRFNVRMSEHRHGNVILIMALEASQDFYDSQKEFSCRITDSICQN